MVAIVILFVYSQFRDVSDFVANVPLLSDLVQTTTTDGRRGLSDDAFQIGQVGIVKASDTELSLTDLFQKVESSVVQITDSSETDIFESRLGSGFVYDDNGHIITNHHVVSGGGNRLDVTFPDGTVYRASLIGSDPSADIAVLYVEDVSKEKLLPLSLADSSNVRVGERVAAIGNPFGLSGSLTSGIVSGVGRQIPAQDDEGFTIPDILQTDAPINPGNSGGPLLNMQEQVIGINTAGISASEQGGSTGVGFAISSTMVTRVVPALIEKGHYTHHYVGFTSATLTSDLATTINASLPINFKGVYVDQIKKSSPADKAGIHGSTIDQYSTKHGGDIITAVDGQTITKSEDLISYIDDHKSVGDSVVFTIYRNGHILNLKTTLAARPSTSLYP